MDSLRGRFLIASPHLPDSNFAHTVVLMVEHHEEGALGLILNRPTNTSLESIWHFLDSEPCETQHCLSLGGPVEGQVMCLHGHMAYSEGEVLPGVYLATDIDQIRKIVEDDTFPFRVFWGYAGWGAAQLESEIEVGGWLTGDATAEAVFQNDLDSLWKQAVSRSGQEILREALHISHFPDDPQLN